MGKIFYIMGKSASGKDTIYKELMEKMPKFHSIVPYTTRPMREGEKDGVEYFFVDQERFDEMMDEEKIIEFRSYNTKCGIWTYFTADDGQIELWQYDYLVIGTIESYYALKEYFGDDVMVPLYIEVEDGLRLSRAGPWRTSPLPTMKTSSRRSSTATSPSTTTPRWLTPPPPA